MKKLFNLLLKNNLTISFAESMTGGYLSSELTKIKNASKVFSGAIIAYTNDIKTDILKVDNNIINKYSVVSNEVSKLMALGLKDIIESNIYVSVTGNAGPSLQQGTNDLKVFYTIIYSNNIYNEQVIFNLNNRIKNIKITKDEIIKKLEKIINGQ